MISVLHTHRKNDSTLASYVSVLMKAVEVQASASITQYVADSEEAFADVLSRHRPDIVHVHGPATWALAQGQRRVVTIHGSDVPLAGAYVAIARSEAEAKRVTATVHVETVRNPLITKTTTAEAMATAMVRIYFTVMNSNVLPLMNADTRQMLRHLLQAGICGDRRWLSPLSASGDVEWQRLFTYSDNEGVLALVMKGLSVSGLTAPQYQPAPCYLPIGYQQPKQQTGKDAASLIHQIAEGHFSLLTLARLDHALRFQNIDEQLLISQLKADRLLPQLPAIMQLLSEQTGLTEGFMLCPAADDRHAQHLRNLLTNHLAL